MNRRVNQALAFAALLSALGCSGPAEEPAESVVAQDLTIPVQPRLVCVVDRLDGRLTAFFTYQNDGLTASLPIGAKNRFVPAPSDRGQPDRFVHAAPQAWPDFTLSVDFPDDEALVWHLGSGSARANAKSDRCPDHKPPTWPPGSSLSIVEDGGRFVRLQWTAAVDESAIDGYRIYANGALVKDGLGRGKREARIGRLDAARAYRFQIQAGDTQGNWSSDGPAAVRDRTPPVVTISGVTDGLVTAAASVTPVFTATDDLLLSVTATLDGAPFVSGTPVSAEGAHRLSVTAVDQGGNRTTAAAGFTLDRTAPAIDFSGATDGSWRTTAATLAWLVRDLTATRVVATLDGQDVASGVVVAGEGAHRVFISALDAAGNSSQLSLSFHIDRTPPSVALLQPAAGDVLGARDVQVAAAAADEGLLAGVFANGQPLAQAADGTWRGLLTLAEGLEAIVLRAVDAAGNAAETRVQLTVDLTPPSLMVVAPDEGAKIGALSILVRGTVQDATPVRLTVGGSPAPVGAGGAFSVPVQLVPGANTVVVAATDAAGNSTSVQRQVRVNLTAPSLSIGSPAAGLITADASVRIEGTARPADSADAVTVTVDGVPAPVAPGGSFSAPATLAAGINSFQVAATDGYGLRTSVLVTVVRDVTPPEISIRGVSDGDYSSAASLSPAWSASDDHLASLTATLDGAPAASGAPVGGEGTHRIDVEAVDQAGNRARASVHFVLDRTPPAVSISGAADGERRNTPAQITFSATDLNLDTVRAELDGAPFTSGTLVAADGLHTVSVEARDRAGNAASARLSFTIQSTPPSLLVTAPRDGLVTADPLVEAIATIAGGARITQATAAGTVMTLRADGAWHATVALVEGPNAIEIAAVDEAGNVARQTLVVVLDTHPPELAVAAPVEGRRLAALQAEVTGTVHDATATTLTINGRLVLPDAAGAFSATADLTAGANTIVVVAVDAAGNQARVERHLRSNVTPPSLSIAAPAEGTVFSAAATAMRVMAAPADSLDAVSVTVQGIAAVQATDGSFGATVPLQAGANTLHAVATDGYGLTSTATVGVVQDSVPPQIQISGVSDRQLSSAASLAPIFGATDDRLASVSGNLDGAPFASGTPVTGEGQHVLVVTAADTAGNQASATVRFELDRTPPAVQIGGIADGTRSRVPVSLTFTATDTNLDSAQATLDGTPVPLQGITAAAEGPHLARLSASDRAGNAAQAQLAFTVDLTAPAISVVAPDEGRVTNATSIDVVVQIAEEGPLASATAGGEPLSLASDGTWQARLALAEGGNTIEILATDAAGNAGRAVLHVVRDATPPSLSVPAPAEGAFVAALQTTVTGTATDVTGVTVTVSGVPVATAADGSFSATVQLVQGANAIDVTATDAAGNAATVTRNVRANVTAPSLSITAPSGDLSTSDESVQVAGNATPGDPGDHVSVLVNGTAAATAAGGSFSATVSLASGPNSISVLATDSYGLQAQATITVTRTAPPPPDAGTPGPDAGSGGGAGPLSVVFDGPASGAILGTRDVALSGHVSGGTPPLALTVDGAPVALSGSSFTTTISPAEGDHDAAAVVSDSAGQTASAHLHLIIDRTPPAVSISRPAANPATVNETPYLLQGSASDDHLSSVTVQGAAVTVSGGFFFTPVALAAGETDVVVVASDLAGNQSTFTQHFSVMGLPPSITLLQPLPGSEASTPLITVRVRVDGSHRIAQVTIGSGAASEVGGGEYQAQVALALGDNQIPVTARDIFGLTGAAMLSVHYRDPATEPLTLQAVEPSAGAEKVLPDTVVSVTFNKPFEGSTLADHFRLLVDGAPVAGGYAVSPSAQTASFIPRDPLPDGARVTVQVSGVDPAAGPGMASDFTSDFTVRPPLARISGAVLDESHEPIGGIQVVIEGQDLVTTTAADGNWIVFAKKPGPAVIRVEGGRLPDGRTFQTIRRNTFVADHGDTSDRPIVIVPTEGFSAQRVDAGSGSLHLVFNGLYPGLALDVDQGGLAFADGTSTGSVTATRLPVYAAPPNAGRRPLRAVWQLGPAGVSFLGPVTLTMPNLSGDLPGKGVLVYAWDPKFNLLAPAGLAQVSPDGATVRTLQPLSWSSFEYFGYATLSAEEQTTFAAGLPVQGVHKAEQRSDSLFTPPVRAMKGRLHPAAERLSTGTFADWFFWLDNYPSNTWVRGRVHTRSESRAVVSISAPAPASWGVGSLVTLPYSLPVAFNATRPVPLPGQVIRVSGTILAYANGTQPIAPPTGETWEQGPNDLTVNLSGTVPLSAGSTRIDLTGTAYAGPARFATTRRLIATLSLPDSAAFPDAGPDVYVLKVVEDPNASAIADEAIAGGAAVFPGIPIWVGGELGDAVTDGSGLYVKSVEYWADTLGDLPTYINYARFTLPSHAVQDGPSHWRQEPTRYYASSPAYSVAPQLPSIDIYVDARALTGRVQFVDKDGRALPQACDDGRPTKFRDDGTLEQIAAQDVGTTEVHFFREDDLVHPIANIGFVAPVAPAGGCGGGQWHGIYDRLRIGPTDFMRLNFIQQCAALAASGNTTGDFFKSECAQGVNRKNLLRLQTHDRLVIYAINHATGYSGLKVVEVPPIGVIPPTCTEPKKKFKLEGRDVELPGCAVASLKITADLKLFPPEIDVRVARRAPDEGVDHDPKDTLVRRGGSGTTRDDFLRVATHWRVRRKAAPDAGPPDAGPDAGAPDAGPDLDCAPFTLPDGGVVRSARSDGGDCGMQRIRDTGADAGPELEIYCSEVPPGGDRSKCLNDDTEIVDVPPGVPPIAGRLWTQTGSAVGEPFPIQFDVQPGAHSQIVNPSVPVLDAVGAKLITGNLTKAHYFVHLVGKPVQPRDPPAPDFSDDPSPPPGEPPAPGRPRLAIGLKNVYTGLDGDGRKRLRYDRAREHEFGILEIGSHAITGGDTTNPRDLLGAGTSAAAGDQDTAYQFLMTLLEPQDVTRAPRPGEYELRLGDDVAGMTCKLQVQDFGPSKSLTGSCGGESLMDVLGASDILYLELYLSGNADNILYRFNFNGLTRREDHLTVGMKTTGAKEVESESTGGRVPRRPVMDPALAQFFVQPSELKHGTVKVCLTSDCVDPDGMLKVVRFDYDPGTAKYTLTDTGTGRTDTKQVAVTRREGFGVEDAQFFTVPLPNDVVKGTGLFDGAVYIRYEPQDPPLRPFFRPLGQPVKTPQSQAARPPGHELIGGVDVADGHLTLSYEDLSVPEGGTSMRFTRTYNNQNNTIHPIGLGWTHNFEGVVLEEDAGRYSVILDGQAYDFPKCEVTRDPPTQLPTAVANCLTDKDHGGHLTVQITLVGTVQVWLFRFTRAGDGSAYLFKRESVRNLQQKRNEGGRKWLLTFINDGLGLMELTYRTDTDLLESAQRQGGKLKLKLTYSPIDQVPGGAAFPNPRDARLQRVARADKLELLDKVEIVRASDGSLVDSATYEHEFDPATSVAADLRVGNLTRVRRDTENPAWRWTYQYLTIAPSSPEDVWVNRNELVTADFEVGSIVQKHFAWERTGGVAPYEHVDRREVVDRILQPGQGGKQVQLTFSTGNDRGVDVPNATGGFDHWDLTLNDFGNVTTKVNAATGASSVSWLSSSDTGIARPSDSASGSGLAFHMEYASATDPDPLGLKSTALTAGPAGSVPSPSLTPGATLKSFGDYDPQWTRPRRVDALAAGGGQRSVQQQFDSTGQTNQVQVSDGATTIPLLSISHDIDGSPMSGSQPDGSSVQYAGPNEFGLAQQITVTAPSGGGGGLSSSVTTLQYSPLGRLMHRQQSGTGADETFDYDGLGRTTLHTVAGDAPASWTWSYDQAAASTLVITAKLNGQVVGTRKFEDGLLTVETWAWGAGRTGQQINTYVGGKLTSVARDTGTGAPITRTYFYDAAGRVQEIRADGLLQAHYELDPDGRVKSVTDAQGRTTTILYDKLGRAVQWDYGGGDVISVVRDPSSGQVVRRTEGAHTLILSRDPTGRLTSVQSSADPASYNVTYGGNDGAGRFSSMHDDGLDETYQYGDALGRMTQRIRTVGASTLTETWDYSATSSGSKSIAHQLLTNGTPASHDVTTTFDANGWPLTVTDSVDGASTRNEFHYDARGRVLTEKRAAGSSREQISIFSYDDAGALTGIVTPGSTTTYIRDANGRLLEQHGPRVGEVRKYGYDSLDRVTSVSVEPLHGVPAKSFIITYDPTGGATTVTDAANVTTKRVTNARGLVLSEVVSGGGGSLTTTRAYDGQWVKQEKVVEGAWQLAVDKTYDDRGRVLTEKESWSGSGESYLYQTTTDWSAPLSPVATHDWGGGSRIVQLTLDGLRNVVARSEGGTTETFVHDAQGKLVSSQLADRLKYEYEYEASGRVKHLTRGSEQATWSYFADGLVSEYVDFAGRRQDWSYDLSGRATEQRAGPLSTFFVYEDDGDRPTRVQPPGAEWKYSWGADGQMASVEMPGGLGATTYRYNADGTLRAIDAPGLADSVTYTYDFLKRIKTRTRGTEMTWSTGWTDGNSRTQDALGNVVTQTLDGRGRAVKVRYQPGAQTVAGLAEVTTSYTDLDQPAAVGETRAGGSASITYAFDDRGRTREVTRTEGTDVTKVTYGWKPYDEVETVTTAAGTIGYDYDSHGRVQSVTGGSAGPTAVAWEPGGARLRSVSGPQFKEVRCYDPQQGWVRQVVAGTNVDSNCNSSSAWARYEYDYDSRGNRTQEKLTDASGGPRLTVYGYDAADRLTGVLYPDHSAAGYKLSASGSRLAEAWAPSFPASAVPDYDSVAARPPAPAGQPQPAKRSYVLEPDERLKEIRDGSNTVIATLGTDKAGRVHSLNLGGVQRELKWDAAGRLVSAHVVDTAGASRDVGYTYDFQGLRIRSSSPAHTASYTWAGTELVAADDSIAGPQLFENVGGTVASAGGERIVHDGLDSATGAAVGGVFGAQRQYDAFGNFTAGEPAAGEPTVAYAGQHWDPDVGLSYAQQRWYAPQIGRFLSDDSLSGSLARPGSQNPYAYANANPTTFRDPDGRSPTLVSGAVGAVLGGLIGCAVGAYATDVNTYVVDSNGYEGLPSRWGGCGKGAAVGVVVGGLAGLTLGASMYATGLGAGIAEGGGASLLVSATLAGAVGGYSYGVLEARLNGATWKEANDVGFIMALPMAAAPLLAELMAPLMGAAGAEAGFTISEARSMAAAKLVSSLATEASTQRMMIFAGYQTEGFSWKGLAIAGLIHFAGEMAFEHLAEHLWAEGGGPKGGGGGPHGEPELALRESAPPDLESEQPRVCTGEACVGGTFCFVAGTRVDVPGGQVAIEKLRAGDEVLARGDDGELVWRKVLATHVTPDREVGTVSVEASDGTTDRIGVTPGHPFWTEETGWIRADQLKPGQELFTSHGGWLRVTGSTWAQERATVYNLSVEDAHTYFVGETSALVHNTCPSGKGRMGMAGKTHEVTGVRFNADGFPEFQSLHVVDLPEAMVGPGTSDPVQFRYATRQLRQAIEENPGMTPNFTAAQLEDIARGEPYIDELTWHHNESNQLELVDRRTHRATGHRGGRALTGGRGR